MHGQQNIKIPEFVATALTKKIQIFCSL